MSLFEDLRREAYGEPRKNYYRGVPELSPTEMEAFSKDTDTALWRKSVKFTDRLYRKRFR